MTPELYISEPMKIGKHIWRMVFSKAKDTFTYEWKSAEYSDHWRTQSSWATYDFNDGIYLGLPKSLVKLYQREEPTLLAYSKGNGVVETQGELAL